MIKERTWGWRLPLQVQKFELPASVGYSPRQRIELLCSSHDHTPHTGKKVSLMTFRDITYHKHFHCIYTIMTYLKKLIRTKSLNTKSCLAGLSSRIIHTVSPFLPKNPLPMMLLCCPQQVWTVSPSSESFWQTLGMGENPTQQTKIYLSLSPGKSFLINLHLLLQKYDSFPAK